MLIDAAHPEETRVVVLSGTRLDEFDFESSTKKQVKGNIYLAKVTRVEPSLQAAFVDYGGNRHGFLAFDEIHPDYYRIPVGDREAALPGSPAREHAGAGNGVEDEGDEPDTESETLDGDGDEDGPDPMPDYAADEPAMAMAAPIETVIAADQPHEAMTADEAAGENDVLTVEPVRSESIETFGGDEIEEAEAERPRSRPSRHYKIQEVIKRRQIMLVQVVKEERGNKGAALTTYLSLAGRYCVLMPNTGRGGGVSRKITSMSDRRRLKEILEDLEIPGGMGVIVRTAGAERSKAEIKRDYEYLLRLWSEIRELTLQSSAPALIYEEGNLIKRSIRDLYARDIDEVQIEGEEGYRTAKDFMRMLMPSHAKRVQPYRDPQVALFQRFQVESQIDAIHSPVAQLRSGGYVVINQTEALVAIDVNSGRATRERNIEETALRTNLEAAEEIARQLRLRDLAGLIVIDFIDMEEHRNHGSVERRLKEALKNDRARIQVGRISPFGLLEMSRQRLRPSLAEASTQPCPHCAGTGTIRSTESTALHVLRSIEEEGVRQRSAEVCIYVATPVALYLLNQKRESLTRIEQRYGVQVLVDRDDSLIPPNFRLERLRAHSAGELAAPRPIQIPTIESDDEDPTEDEDVEAKPAPRPRIADHARPNGEDEKGRRRRRRRRRRPGEPAETRDVPAVEASAPAEAEGIPTEAAGESDDGEGERRRRRRGRRGGRWRSRREDAAGETLATETMAQPPEESSGESETSVVALDVDNEEVAEEAVRAAPVAVPHREMQPAGRAWSEPARADGVSEAAGAVADELEPEVAAEPAEAEASDEPLPVSATIPGADVHAVADKPANPRKGWWQRLVES
jgi:ribonuclease E